MTARRFILAGLPAAAASLALPGIAKAEEEPSARIDRLTQELSGALDGWANGTFRAIVEPDSKSCCPVVLQNMRLARENENLVRFLKTAPAIDLVEYHAHRLGVSLAKHYGGRWVTTSLTDRKVPSDFVLFVRHPGEGSFVQNFA